MNKAIRIIGNTCVYCAVAGFAAIGLIIATTLVYVLML